MTREMRKCCNKKLKDAIATGVKQWRLLFYESFHQILSAIELPIYKVLDSKSATYVKITTDILNLNYKLSTFAFLTQSQLHTANLHNFSQN